MSLQKKPLGRSGSLSRPGRQWSARRSPMRLRGAFSGRMRITERGQSARAGPGSRGSSSGSASAVAGGLVDFALGSDTGGSVRVLASFCGLYGLRPTHGRIPLDGVLLQAPSYDTVGWFARDAETLARIGAVLLQNEITEVRPSRLVIAEDAFELADKAVADALLPVVETAASLIGDSGLSDFHPQFWTTGAVSRGCFRAGRDGRPSGTGSTALIPDSHSM